MGDEDWEGLGGGGGCCCGGASFEHFFLGWVMRFVGERVMRIEGESWRLWRMKSAKDRLLVGFGVGFGGGTEEWRRRKMALREFKKVGWGKNVGESRFLY